MGRLQPPEFQSKQASLVGGAAADVAFGERLDDGEGAGMVLFRRNMRCSSDVSTVDHPTGSWAP